MHRFPFVCVSIGLAVEGRPVLGVVYNPILHELFTAVQGQGAFLNGAPPPCMHPHTHCLPIPLHSSSGVWGL